MKKLLLVGLLPFMAALAQASDPAVDQHYAKTCALCHATGAANAPKTGVASDWAPRLQKGMDTLVQSVQNGLNAMPPKGMCMNCSADDFKALIEYMSAAQ
ncbi:c-type cytochrome [Dasania sp. GY-MA-18]|uniref:C-type cytochrome n=1 Tax=Dasania phycosphaerae TaxID=2950436 RepID=A0A9J6RQ79_9GAMM|nr:MULTISPECIES: c-type cytochrome [Dasania]MCR8923755.1 c-type cytochrome [Dasania sp. GY-MA-18]MCZ0866189.1 c-type cytochrome [Dasania phycosphaerae]MCZ0869913.1 c-type cytochrome [Dasania phycosphaerae]